MPTVIRNLDTFGENVGNSSQGCQHGDNDGFGGQDFHSSESPTNKLA